jgi:hypothetical protein
LLINKLRKTTCFDLKPEVRFSPLTRIRGANPKTPNAPGRDQQCDIEIGLASMAASFSPKS